MLHGHEAKVIKLIVERISLELRSINMGIDENLIGMEQRMQDLDPYLEIGSDDVRIIGIKGMGGAGKTTLARTIFDKLSIDFEGKSFVENVREISKSPLLGLKKLQEQILIDILKDKSITISSVHQGTNLMKTMLCGKKVLLVLDDVDHKDQLEALAGELNWFKQGSRIIITTRDEQVLITHRVKMIRDVDLLSDEEAMRLFHRYAFREDIPFEEYEMQSLKVVRYAAGLPLTIKVLGSFLYGKSNDEWNDALARLKTIPLKETLKILELSYQSLEDDYKEIFLDVACFVRHFTNEHAIRILESCRFHATNGLRVLEQKSLIKIVGTFKGGFIHMHDRIVEMGENIVRREHPDEPDKHSRLWIYEEIKHVLANNLGTEATKCIDLKYTHETVFENIENMHKLRCLIVSNGVSDHISNDFVKIDEARQYFPNSLQYLYWYRYPHSSLPKTFEANNLVTLEMSESKIKLWEGGKVMRNLKFVDLSFSNLRSFDLGVMPNLEKLHLQSCRDLVKLYVHDGKIMKKLKFLCLGSTKLRNLDLGLTPNLERLELQYCTDLIKLYVHGGCLKTLVYLNLRGCESLKSLVFIRQLESLEVLRIGGLHLREFPDCVITGHSVNSLLELHLSGNHIKEVPSSIQNLHKLVSLVLDYCWDLKTLPRSICSLQHLRTLHLQFTSIEELPEELSQLESLEKLDLAGTHVKHFPPSICMLKRLRTLILRGCKLVEKLPEDIGKLESLEKLDLTYCCNLRDIPNNICKLKRLKAIKLEGCEGLKKLPDDLGDLACLQLLNIEDTCITHLPPSIHLLKGLKICRSEPKDQISNDDFIQLCFKYDSEKRQILGFQHLRILDLGRCGIEELPEALGYLERLERLNLSYTDVKHLPHSICMLKHLKKFVLQRCVLLEKLPDSVGQLESLEGLDLSRCYSIREIPSSICMLKQLKCLSLWHCFCLEKLPEDVGELESLENFYITRCYNIREIPNSICKLKRLKVLNLGGCRRLEKLPEEMGFLECLQELTIWDTGISHLPPSNSLLNGLKIFGFTSYIRDLSDASLSKRKVSTITYAIVSCLLFGALVSWLLIRDS